MMELILWTIHKLDKQSQYPLLAMLNPQIFELKNPIFFYLGQNLSL